MESAASPLLLLLQLEWFNAVPLVPIRLMKRRGLLQVRWHPKKALRLNLDRKAYLGELALTVRRWRLAVVVVMMLLLVLVGMITAVIASTAVRGSRVRGNASSRGCCRRRRRQIEGACDEDPLVDLVQMQLEVKGRTCENQRGTSYQVTDDALSLNAIRWVLPSNEQPGQGQKRMLNSQ